MGRDQFPEGPLPEDAGDVLSVKAAAEVLQGAFEFAEHSPAPAMAPLDVKLAAFELQPAVRGVRSHPDVRKKPGGGSAAKEPVRLEADSVRPEAEARQKVRACRLDEVDQAEIGRASCRERV